MICSVQGDTADRQMIGQGEIGVKRQGVLLLNIEVTLLADDKLQISLPENSFILDTPAVVALIDRLGEARLAMTPAVDGFWPAGQKVEANIDPHWRTENDALGAGALLHFRHGSFGWIHFHLSPLVAAQLAEALIRQVNALPVSHSKSSAN